MAPGVPLVLGGGATGDQLNQGDGDYMKKMARQELQAYQQSQGDESVLRRAIHNKFLLHVSVEGTPLLSSSELRHWPSDLIERPCVCVCAAGHEDVVRFLVNNKKLKLNTSDAMVQRDLNQISVSFVDSLDSRLPLWLARPRGGRRCTAPALPDTSTSSSSSYPTSGTLSTGQWSSAECCDRAACSMLTSTFVDRTNVQKVTSDGCTALHYLVRHFPDPFASDYNELLEKVHTLRAQSGLSLAANHRTHTIHTLSIRTSPTAWYPSGATSTPPTGTCSLLMVWRGQA
jgi:hypothetical protein